MRRIRSLGVRATFVRATFVALVASFVVGVAGAAASAQEDAATVPDDQIVLTGRLIVPAGQTVDTAAILSGPAIVDGSVRRTVFVLNGNAEISGSVGQDVVVVNGDLVVGAGSHIGGDIVTNSPPRIERGATIDGRLRRVSEFNGEGLNFPSRIAWWVAYSASSLILGLVLLVLFPGIDDVAASWRDRIGRSIGFGAAAFFLMPIVGVLLFVTVVGIPLGLFVLLALAFVYTVGYVAGAQALGRILIRPPTSRFLVFLVGWVILRVIGLVPILGGFVWLTASVIGLGVLTAAGRRPSTAAVPPPPPPLPAPV